MSNRRKLRPHEVAKRDQAYAWATDHVMAGDAAMVVESVPPGFPCCWCDCPDVPDSPHLNPGYVCGNLCPDAATHVVQYRYLGNGTDYLVCDRHQTGPLQQLAAYGLVEEVVMGDPWRDSE